MYYPVEVAGGLLSKYKLVVFAFIVSGTLNLTLLALCCVDLHK